MRLAKISGSSHRCRFLRFRALLHVGIRRKHPKVIRYSILQTISKSSAEKVGGSSGDDQRTNSAVELFRCFAERGCGGYYAFLFLSGKSIMTGNNFPKRGIMTGAEIQVCRPAVPAMGHPGSGIRSAMPTPCRRLMRPSCCSPRTALGLELTCELRRSYAISYERTAFLNDYAETPSHGKAVYCPGE